MRENLEDENEVIFGFCDNLHRSGHIQNFFVVNGFVKIVMNGTRRPIKIEHMLDLMKKFPELNFGSSL